MSNPNIKESKSPAALCIIWMHGLGADATDMEGLTKQLPLSQLPIHHVFMNAPMRPITINAGMTMRGWYDIIGTNLTDRADKEGILHSQSLIEQAITRQIEAGYQPHQIVLAGFSQGGAMALHTGLHSTLQLGGIISLSAYLPLPEESQPLLGKNTPIFLGSGQFDPIVLPTWTQLTQQWLIKQTYQAITWHQYPMDHSICLDEINDLACWLTNNFINGDNV